MALQPVPWDDRYLTGIAEIDLEHRTLIVLLNDVIAALQRRVSAPTAHSMLRSVETQFVRHFRSEEALLRRLSYPDADRHAAEHWGHERAIAAALVEANTDVDVHDVTRLLREWVTTHLRDGDHALADWVRTGTQPSVGVAEDRRLQGAE